MTTPKKGRPVRRGFTLIELMIVIAIILALGGLVSVAVFARRDQAKADLVRSDLNTIKQALKLFRLDYERWPSDTEGLRVLWDKAALDPESDTAKWRGYLEEPMPSDKWGHEWGYLPESEEVEGMYDLWSNGPDGEEGTEDDVKLDRPSSEEDGAGAATDSGSGPGEP